MAYKKKKRMGVSEGCCNNVITEMRNEKCLG